MKFTHQRGKKWGLGLYSDVVTVNCMSWLCCHCMIIVSAPWCCRKKCEMVKLSTETTVSAEANSTCCEMLPSREGRCHSNRHTPSCGKRKRQYKWQRQRKHRQLKAQGPHSLIPCTSSNTEDEWLADLKCDVNLSSGPLLKKVIYEVYTAVIKFDLISSLWSFTYLNMALFPYDAYADKKSLTCRMFQNIAAEGFQS